MKLHLEWSKPVMLRDGSKLNLIYSLDEERLPDEAGVYVFARRWAHDFEALYVGKAQNIRVRVTQHLNNNVRLMQRIKTAAIGHRVVLAAKLTGPSGGSRAKRLQLTERALIRHFLTEGHDLVNVQGARLRQHEIQSSKRPAWFVPKTMFLDTK
jgi:hypothetical protein